MQGYLNIPHLYRVSMVTKSLLVCSKLLFQTLESNKEMENMFICLLPHRNAIFSVTIKMALRIYELGANIWFSKVARGKSEVRDL